MKEGNFFVIEGTDGSGKTEQFKLLLRRLKKEGFDVRAFDFPRYGKPSAYFVEKYLKGKYGGWKEVGPYKASVYFAVDRDDASQFLKKWLKLGKIAVSNRYVPSNMGHQGAKIEDKSERAAFWRWVYEFEYEIMGVPKPILSIILHMPAKIAFQLKKKQRNAKKGKRDIHEKSLEHLKLAEETYLEMARLFPKDFIVIECVEEVSGPEDKKLLTIKEIHEKVWDAVRKYLKK